MEAPQPSDPLQATLAAILARLESLENAINSGLTSPSQQSSSSNQNPSGILSEVRLGSSETAKADFCMMNSHYG